MKNFNSRFDVNHLIQLYEAGRLAQSLLISVGADQQEDVARRLARRVLCQDQGRPDCECRSCRTALVQHPDFIEVLASSRKISIDAVRQAVTSLLAGPVWSHAKVVVVRPAESLGREAESYFLKHLEEPPAFVHYVLLTQAPDAVIATIKSRCQLWRLEGLKRPDSVDWEVTRDIIREPLTSQRVVQIAYMARDQYRRTGQKEWLNLWDTVEDAFRELEANGNEDLVRARILGAWPADPAK